MELSPELIVFVGFGLTILAGLHGILYPRYLLKQVQRLSRALDEFRAEGRHIPVRKFSPSTIRSLADNIESSLTAFTNEQMRSRRREEMLANYLADICQKATFSTTNIGAVKSPPDSNGIDLASLETDFSQQTYNLTGAQRSIQDLIDLTRMESHIMEPQPSSFFVSDLARFLQREFRTEAAQKHITFSVELVPHLPPVYADESLIERALSHIVGTAIKETPPGGHVAILFEPSLRGVRVSVRDTGHGRIHNEGGASHPFDQVYQKAPSCEQGDTVKAHIGMALAKCILDRHDSFLEVYGLPNHGTKIQFELTQDGQYTGD